MPRKIVHTTKSPPIAKRNPLRNRSYDVIPALGPKVYPSRSYEPRVLPPQIPPEFVAAPYSIRGTMPIYALPEEMEELELL